MQVVPPSPAKAIAASEVVCKRLTERKKVDQALSGAIIPTKKFGESESKGSGAKEGSDKVGSWRTQDQRQKA